MLDSNLIATAEFRDPIHGFIEVYPHERDIIDTGEFQRLRRIHQLGLTHYVYHGAEHSRFGHALGVMHLAGQAVTNLLERHQDEIYDTLGWSPSPNSDEQRRLVILARLAGLLHDIGHAPFSHTGEDKLFPGEARHESHGAAIIKDSEIGQIIDSDERCRGLGITKDQVADFLLGIAILPEGFVQELISSPWDVDKMDYLLRDSHYCGVQYGTYDLSRILNTLTLDHDPQSGSLNLAINSGGVHALEAFVLARYYMFTQIYFHDVRRAFDLILTDFIEELLKIETSSGRYPDIDALDEYLRWDDNRVMFAASQMVNPTSKNLAWRIIHRQHPKAVFETSDSPDAGIIRRVDELGVAVKRKFDDVQFWQDRAVDHPDRFRVETMMVNFGGKPPVLREFSRESQPLSGLTDISKYRFYADVRGNGHLENEVRDFCRSFMA